MKIFAYKLVLAPLLALVGLFFAAGVCSVSAASLVLDPPFGDIKAGDTLSVDVVVKGNDELVDGVDANIAYDVNFLKVKEMKKGEFFSNYPTLKDDNGQVKITALAPDEGVKVFGDIVVATLVFDILDSGETNLTVAFEEGATSESNLSEHGTAKDLLTEVTSGAYQVEATEERLQEARARKVRQSGLIPVLIFIILIIIVGAGIWYYRKKKKTEEEYFVPEAFPMDEVPKSDEPPQGTSPPSQ